MAQGRLCGIHYAAEHDKLSGSLFRNPTPHMTLGGCLCLYFSLLGIFYLQKHFLRWHSNCMVNSSVKITLSNVSISSRHFLHQSNCFCLLASRIAWQYLAVVKVQPSSLQRLAMVRTPYWKFAAVNFCEDIFEGRSSKFIISSHCFNNATIMAFWDSFWRSTYGEVSCNSCHCHFLTSLGPHRNNSCSLIVA